MTPDLEFGDNSEVGFPFRFLLLAAIIGPVGAARAADPTKSIPAQAVITIKKTDLRAAACRRVVDPLDPNETPYRVCPGVAGYSLALRPVDSGRMSIDIIDPAQRTLPQDYTQTVTPHASTLGEEATWWFAGNSSVPIALVIPVQERNSADDPAAITTTYSAVSKITPDAVCVTDRIAHTGRFNRAVRHAALGATQRPCRNIKAAP